MTDPDALRRLRAFEIRELLVRSLGWRPSRPAAGPRGTPQLIALATRAGVSAYLHETPIGGRFPDYPRRRALRDALGDGAAHALIVFTDHSAPRRCGSGRSTRRRARAPTASRATSRAATRGHCSSGSRASPPPPRRRCPASTPPRWTPRPARSSPRCAGGRAGSSAPMPPHRAGARRSAARRAAGRGRAARGAAARDRGVRRAGTAARPLARAGGGNGSTRRGGGGGAGVRRGGWGAVARRARGAGAALSRLPAADAVLVGRRGALASRGAARADPSFPRGARARH